MSIPTFTPGYPLDGQSLGDSKAAIRDNLDGTFQTLNVDHVNNNGAPGSNPAGYHTVIHEVTQTTATSIPGVNQVFSGIPGSLSVDATLTPAVPNNGDTQLYSLTGSGGLSQLTGYDRSVSGYQWLGGVLMQWGLAPGIGSDTVSPILFPIPFPSGITANVLSITVTSTITGIPVSGSNASRIIITGSVSSTGFSTRTPRNIGDQGLYWLAIGY